MSEITVKASETRGEEAKSAEILYDFGDNIQESITLFGEDIVHKMFLNAAKISAQSIMRRMLKAGRTQEEIQRDMAEWKVGVSVSVENEAVTVENISKRAAQLDAASLRELLSTITSELEVKQGSGV